MDLTRRDLLAAFLGAPFAAMACRGKSKRPLPPGQVVGASYWVGHRLRDVLSEAPAADAWIDREVVIVGGGAAGLTAAWRFAHAGFEDFTILELEPVEGGTSRSGTSPVSPFPWGAHYVPAPLREDRPLIRVLSEVGVIEGTDAAGDPVIAEQFLCRDPAERVFYRGRWYEGLYLTAGASPEDVRQLREFEAEIDRWVAWRDGKGRRAFAIPTAAASDDAEVMALDRISAQAWLDQHRWTSPRLRWFVEYACRDDYGSLLEETSAWAAVFYFASRMSAPGKESQPLITWPEGNGRLIRHFASSAKGRIDRNWVVVSLQPREGGVDVIARSADGRHLRGIHAKAVIFAGPQFVAARVIPGYRDVREFIYGSWLVANLAVSQHPGTNSFPLAWDNVFYESPSLGYVVATHQTERNSGPTVLTYYYAFCDRDPRVARERLLSANRDQWAEVVMSDMERAHPEIRRVCDRLDIMQWGHAMVRPATGFIDSAARRSAREPFRGIHFANSDLSGIGLFEEALFHGIRAAEEVLRSRGRAVETFL